MSTGEQEMAQSSALADTVRLASRSQLLGSLHAMASHDFRDSLNALTINVELLARTLSGDAPRGGEDEVRERCIGALRRELKRLEQSTGRALEEARTEAGKAQRIDLRTVVESVVFPLGRSAARQRVELTFAPPRDTIEVIGVADELRHALFNVALNALEAMTNGGTLTFELTREGSAAVVAVTDTGTGVLTELDARVWDLFFTTKPQKLGLGLHVVKNIAASHGGSAILDRSGSGVRFQLRLPVVPAK